MINYHNVKPGRDREQMEKRPGTDREDKIQKETENPFLLLK